jgi:hypothetical protein
MTQQQRFLRTGGMFAVLGAAIILASMMLGPLDLRADGPATVMAYFADNAGRLQMHGLGVTVGKLLMLGGFVALYTSLGDNGWAKMGMAGAVLATAINIVGPVFGGAVLPAIGQAYVQLPAGEAAGALYPAQSFYYFYEALLAPSLLTMAVVLFAFALAVLQTNRFPGWLGWLGLPLGVWLVAGGVAFSLVGPPDAPGIINFFAPGFMLSILWVLIAGIYLWRDGDGPVDERSSAGQHRQPAVAE